MIQNTRAIVLRTVPFGETSLVVSALTRAFGLQTYLVKGARSTGKKGQSLRPYLQPAALLDLVVYHHQTEHLQYVREIQWAHIFNKLLNSVLHHAVATFMVEMILHSIKQTESNPEFFDRLEEYLLLADEAESPVLANLPLHFCLFMAGELGIRPENNFSTSAPYFNLREGQFAGEEGNPAEIISAEQSWFLHKLLELEQPVTVYRVKMNRTQRQEMLKTLETFFSIHVAGFGQLRSPGVLMKLW